MSIPRKDPDFSSLSLKDLVEARDAYHVHLANLQHVVGTAVGKYLIRQIDPDAHDPDSPHEVRDDRRTLSNTVIKKWSWPCVLVFVDEWATPAQLARSPENYIPPRLYLPDGRVAPTCVVYAALDQQVAAPLDRLQFAEGLIGGGYPVLTTVQGDDRIGSIGCLATDGHSVYAVTNRHVAGPAGQEAFTLADGRRIRIGRASSLTVGKVGFSTAYPGWPGLRTQLNVDAGLIHVDDISDWTAQIYGIGEMGELVDANVDTMSLDLIEAPVQAFGGASGEMRGTITALFYRYRSVGGFDYVADFLIGPRNKDASVATRPGDSGTIWFWDQRDTAQPAAANSRPKPRAIGLQWGGAVLEGRGGQDRSQFALATSLSTVCRLLDLELISNWGLGHAPYWGKVGHYKIGAKACDLVADSKLFKLMQANKERVALSDARLEAGELPMNNQAEYVALADVPDLVWRSRRGKDKANHFADMDAEGTGAFAGETLLGLWENDPSTLTPATWTAFYDSLQVEKDAHRGALPFRVRQLYEEMVDAVRKKDVARYVATAGVLAHYVGDACQPLHVSHLHHGRPNHPGEDKVHAKYETDMLDRFRVELIASINKKLDDLEIATSFTGGQAAADATVQLMAFTVETLPPIEVIEAFAESDGTQRIPHMWSVLHDRTITCMAEGALYLAEMWQSAWLEGGGNSIANSKLTRQSTTKLKALYLDKSWVESDWLRNMSFD